MAVSVQWNGVLSLTDNLTGSIQLQKIINLIYTGVTSEFAQSQTIGTSPVSIPMPATPVEFVYVKNVGTTGAIILSWNSVEVGELEQIIVLQPGAFIILMETNTTSGITAMSLTATVATTVEYLLAS